MFQLLIASTKTACTWGWVIMLIMMMMHLGGLRSNGMMTMKITMIMNDNKVNILMFQLLTASTPTACTWGKKSEKKESFQRISTTWSPRGRVQTFKGTDW